jgi:hypothetical protein
LKVDQIDFYLDKKYRRDNLKRDKNRILIGYLADQELDSLGVFFGFLINSRPKFFEQLSLSFNECRLGDRDYSRIGEVLGGSN